MFLATCVPSKFHMAKVFNNPIAPTHNFDMHSISKLHSGVFSCPMLLGQFQKKLIDLQGGRGGRRSSGHLTRVVVLCSQFNQPWAGGPFVILSCKVIGNFLLEKVLILDTNQSTRKGIGKKLHSCAYRQPDPVH